VTKRSATLGLHAPYLLVSCGRDLQLGLCCSSCCAALGTPLKLISAGGLVAWLRCGSCCLLQLAGSGLVKVSRGYMACQVLFWVALCLSVVCAAIAVV
jgi:hypothetical protein